MGNGNGNLCKNPHMQAEMRQDNNSSRSCSQTYLGMTRGSWQSCYKLKNTAIVSPSVWPCDTAVKTLGSEMVHMPIRTKHGTVTMHSSLTSFLANSSPTDTRQIPPVKVESLL